MESRNGAYLTGIPKQDCTVDSSKGGMRETSAVLRVLKKKTCVKKAACCNTGISQHREQQCKEIGWTEKTNTTHLEKATLKSTEQNVLRSGKGKQHHTTTPIHGWSSCPGGFYISTMTRRAMGLVEPTITSAKCCKDVNGPAWSDCVTFGTSVTGWSTCNDGYFMTGIFRNKGCSDLDCVSKIRC